MGPPGPDGDAIVWGAVLVALAASMTPVAVALSPAAAVQGWEQITEVTPVDIDDRGPTGAPGSAFLSYGARVSLDSDTMAVGTAADLNDDSARVYIFESSPNGSWTQTAKLLPPDDEPGNGFGEALALDAESGILVVGRPGHNSPTQQDAGAAYIYERSPGHDQTGGWELVRTLVGPDHAYSPGPRLGNAVAVDGDTVAVGAYDQGTETGNGGAVHLLERGPRGWDRVTVLEPPVPGMIGLGYDLALEDDTLLYSATAAGDLDEGAAYIAERASAGWERTATLVAPDPGGSYGPGSDCFGFQVDLNDGRAVVADPCWDTFLDHHGGITPNTGKAYLFEPSADGWELTAEIHPDVLVPGSAFGTEVGLDGDRLLVTADKEPPQASGAAYVFVHGRSGWQQEARLTANDTGPLDFFGWSGDVSGETVAVGSPFDDDRRDGTPWPLNDDGDALPCLHRDLIWGCDHGEDAGSVYVFEPSSLGERGEVGDSDVLPARAEEVQR